MANGYTFAGGRLDSVAVTVGTPVELTTAGSFDSTYADAAIRLWSTDSVNFAWLVRY